MSGVVALLAAQDPTRDWRALKNLVLAGASTYIQPRDTVTGGRLSAAESLGCNGRYVYGRLTPRRTDLTLPRARRSTCRSCCGSVPPRTRGVSALLQSPARRFAGRRRHRPDQVAGDAVFTGTWTPPPAGGTFDLAFPGSEVIRVTVEGTGPQLRLKSGFPVKANSAGGGYTMGQGIHVLVGNIDDEPLPEILVSGLGTGELHAFKGDGTPVPGWPVVSPPGAPYPALGQLTPGAPALQVFSGHSPGGLAARSGTGALLPGWPRQASNYIASPATLFFFNDTATTEIYTEEEDWKLHAYRADGSRCPAGSTPDSTAGMIATPPPSPIRPRCARDRPASGWTPTALALGHVGWHPEPSFRLFPLRQHVPYRT